MIFLNSLKFFSEPASEKTENQNHLSFNGFSLGEMQSLRFKKESAPLIPLRLSPQAFESLALDGCCYFKQALRSCLMTALN